MSVLGGDGGRPEGLDIDAEIEDLVEHIDSTLGKPYDLGEAQQGYEEVKEHCERMIRAIQVDLARDN